MRLPIVFLALAAMFAAPARLRADDTIHLTLQVGQTVARDVGFAMGHLCDDETIVKAEMRNKTAETNSFVVTGLRPGTTLCRAGTNTVEDRPTFLFEITVVAKPRKR